MLIDILREEEQGNVYVLREPGGLTVDWNGKRVTGTSEAATANGSAGIWRQMD